MANARMNIAVVFDGELETGGGYQQQLSTILELQKLNKYNFIGVVFSTDNKNLLESYGIKSVLVKKSFIDKVFRFIQRQEWFFLFSAKLKIKSLFELMLDKNDIDLVYFLAPSGLSLDLLTHNYITTVWDLCHRDTPEFPEVNHFRQFELREQNYSKSLKKAVAVLVDSELGKKNVVRRYGVDKNRVYPASFLPSINVNSKNVVDVKKKYGIEGDYIFYPAQFWSHKNHIYIIDALVSLINEGVKLTAVFSGSDKGNLKHVLKYSESQGVAAQVKYIGFAPNEEMYSLYKQSLAMVMPSYFGPTNIPPLEAFAVGTPVIYSDLNGLREQVAGAALLCDLKDPISLASHLKALLNSEEVRQRLIEKGTQRLAELEKTSITAVIETILDDYAVKLKCWKAG